MTGGNSSDQCSYRLGWARDERLPHGQLRDVSCLLVSGRANSQTPVT